MMHPAGPLHRVAVVGTGIAGLVAARRLDGDHHVTVFEADTRPGGHSHTHDVEVAGRRIAVDTGFLVHNDVNYPIVGELFADLGVETIESDMSFGVATEVDGVEWAGHSVGAVLAQPTNLARPWFARMLVDIVRLNRRARTLLADDAGTDPSLADWLDGEGFRGPVVDRYLVPLGSAIWSADPTTFDRFPARSLFRFLDQHGLLAVRGRPRWRTVVGGSRTYVDAVLADLRGDVRLGCPVRSVRRGAEGVEVCSPAGMERFDAVVLACHADTSLGLLVDPSPAERDVLGGFGFQRNDAVLHTDDSVLPRARRAWAAWNVRVPVDPSDRVAVTYHLNRLQRLDVGAEVCVTLNRPDRIDPASILATMTYEHPVMDARSEDARRRLPEVQGSRRTWFAGAWAGWGFHEDGARSGAQAADAVGALS